MKKLLLSTCLGLVAASCATDRDALVYPDAAEVPVVYATAETVPVDSTDDAADDPAIWINSSAPAESYILGTDKQAGLGIYTLSGAQQQFIPAGRLNNVDVRQGIAVGLWDGDLAAATNRSDNSVTLFKVDRDGADIMGSFRTEMTEPYGTCLGVVSSEPVVFVTYKPGQVDAHRLISVLSDGGTLQQHVGRIGFEGQLEGCVHDDETGILYIGEEPGGVWKSRVALDGDAMTFSTPVLIDAVDGETGITADVEGVAIYKGETGQYLIISSQGNDSYAVYDLDGENAFRGRFRIAASETSGIDGAQETDGIEATAQPMGPDFPEGVFIVQDGFNRGDTQNFKIVDWRDIADALGLE